MADLTSLIAQPDTATPLLQGIGLARQRQQDIQAQQQQVQANQFAQQQFQAQQAQIQFDNELDLIDKANEAGFTSQRNKRLAPMLGITAEELDALDEASQTKISNAIKQAGKVFKDLKVGTQGTNQQIGTIGQLLKDELNLGQEAVAPQAQVAQAPTQVAPQVLAQVPAQVQATPQDNISQARQGIAQLQGIVPRNTQEKAQLDASVNQLQGFIKDETLKIPKVTTKGKKELLTGTAAELFGILSTSSNADDVKRANKMKEFARLSTDDVGAREREKRNAQIDTAAELEAAKLAGQGKISPKTQQNQSKKLVTNVLVDVKDLFNELKAAGAAVDIKQGSIQNISNAIASSDIGQFFGRGFGTEEQSIRNELKQKEPILLNAIRQATKQGARGLDSDRELDFYLQAITDVGRDIDSQMSALKVLDEAYGLNLGIDVKISNLDANKRLLNRQAKDFANTNQPTQIIDSTQTAPTVQEGTVIENATGDRMIMRGGQWQSQ